MLACCRRAAHASMQRASAAEATTLLRANAVRARASSLAQTRGLSSRLQELRERLNSDEEKDRLKQLMAAEDFDDDDDYVEMVNPDTGEWNGPRGPEPTRYGDWAQKGRCTDFS